MKRRLVFGHLQDKLGGAKVALVRVLIEAACKTVTRSLKFNSTNHAKA